MGDEGAARAGGAAVRMGAVQHMPVEEDDVAGVEDRGLLAGADQGVGLGTVERARRFLHAHLAHPELDVRRVAQAAHVSPAHPVPRFRAEVAVTPMAYLRQRRVSTAIDLLTNTGSARRRDRRPLGFRSVYHFSRTQLRRDRWKDALRPS